MSEPSGQSLWSASCTGSRRFHTEVSEWNGDRGPLVFSRSRASWRNVFLAQAMVPVTGPGAGSPYRPDGRFPPSLRALPGAERARTGGRRRTRLVLVPPRCVRPPAARSAMRPAWALPASAGPWGAHATRVLQAVRVKGATVSLGAWWIFVSSVTCFYVYYFYNWRKNK